VDNRKQAGCGSRSQQDGHRPTLRETLRLDGGRTRLTGEFLEAKEALPGMRPVEDETE